MTSHAPKIPPPSDPADPAPPIAWQPITPRGVAAFAAANLSRLFVVEFIVAAIAAGVVVWLLASAWFPAVRHAINQLPEQGALRDGQLQVPVAAAQTLAERRPFLLLGLDLEHQRNVSQTSDVLIEFHRHNFQACSLLGCLVLDYPRDWRLEFNRPRLAPLWEAWEPSLLSLAGLLVLVSLLASWAVLATAYCGVVRLLGFYKDRALTWRGSWLLASAALLPGALLLSAGLLGYGLGVVDLIRLLLLFLFHFVVGWIYLAISPFFVPRLPSVAPPGANPFATGPEPKKEP